MKKHSGTIHKSICIAVLAAMVASLLLLLAGANLLTARADQLDITAVTSYGADLSRITEGEFAYYDVDETTLQLEAGTEIEITANKTIDSLYIEWYYPPEQWTLRVNGQEYTCGTKGYIQEYVKIPEEAEGTNTVSLTLGNNWEQIIHIYAFSKGPLPDFVHVWDDPWEEADILLFPTHADDEILFFGGIIPTYTNMEDVRVQVAYFTDFFQTEPARSQELLNGLWTMGVTHYPQMGEFYDYYSESLEVAQTQFDHDASVEYIVRTIRRFRPQVVIGQDPLNGEYGHGGHIWCAQAIEEAILLTADPAQYPESAERYGTWDVPKTYFHLYPENTIVLDARVPLARFDGKTALEVAQLAYAQHLSQQWTRFFVSDDYDPDNPEIFNCTRFGLYRTLVGADFSGADILDNITTYDVQQGVTRDAAGSNSEEGQPQQTISTARKVEDFFRQINEQQVITASPGGKNTIYIVAGGVLAVFLLMLIIDVLVLSGSRSRQGKRERLLRAMYQEWEQMERR